MQDLGTVPGTNNSFASSINNIGQVVGYAWYGDKNSGGGFRPFVYSGNGSIQDLNHLVDPTSGWTLGVPNMGGEIAINNSGQIVGRGLNPAGQTHAFLLTPVPEPEKTLPEKAAELAIEVIGAPYLGDGYSYGGKGYDCCTKKFAEPNELKTLGYCYYDGRIKGCNSGGIGVDCSGLAYWSYNRAYFENKGNLSWLDRSKNAPISAYYGYLGGATSEYRYNTRPITKQELLPGDLLFWNQYGDKTKKMEHVIMYVGPFTYDNNQYNVVHAEGVCTGHIVPANYDYNTELVYTDDCVPLKVTDYGRVKVYKLDMEIKGSSPIDLIVTDPDGIVITKELQETEGMYYMEYDVDDDGDTEDIIIIPNKKIGNYLIQVIPEPNTLPTDTYSLEATVDGQTMVLAQDVRIQDIPPQPYEFESKLNRADFDTDGDVDFADLNTLCLHWLEQDCNYPSWCEGADLNYSGFVDFTDFALFAKNWLWEKIPADIDIDGDVDFVDFALFANRWMNENCAEPDWCSGADLNKSGSVDWYDLGKFADNWLEGTGD